MEYEIRKDKKSMAKENNKDRILKLLKECKNHQTAESIAVQLNIQRNTASGILNELVSRLYFLTYNQKINYQRIHLQHLLEQIKA